VFHTIYSCIFHPCYLLLLFPLLHFPPVRSTPVFSTPAFSTPAILLVSHFPLPHFQFPHDALNLALTPVLSLPSFTGNRNNIGLEIFLYNSRALLWARAKMRVPTKLVVSAAQEPRFPSFPRDGAAITWRRLYSRCDCNTYFKLFMYEKAPRPIKKIMTAFTVLYAVSRAVILSLKLVVS